MFGLNDGMRYCQRYVRMSMGINGLYKLVSQEMDLPPLSGAMFFSLACFCRLQGVNFFEYISDVMQ